MLHSRRIILYREKEKVVAASWGTELKQFCPHKNQRRPLPTLMYTFSFYAGLDSDRKGIENLFAWAWKLVTPGTFCCCLACSSGQLIAAQSALKRHNENKTKWNIRSITKIKTIHLAAWATNRILLNQLLTIFTRFKKKNPKRRECLCGTGWSFKTL